MNEVKNLYKFQIEDLLECFKFVKNFHLEPTKSSRGRTNQGKRGFGGELDAWIPGKLVEIGTCKILENYSKDKTFIPDFKIYSNFEVGQRSDPDITEIIDKGQRRDPNTFIEIKRSSPDDDWMGPRMHQFVGKQNGYMIHSSIYFKDNKGPKEKDVIASALQELISINSFDLSEFSKFSDLECKIEYIYSFQDVLESGHLFEAGDIIPKTDIYQSANIIKKDGGYRKGFELIEEFNGDYNLKMRWDNKPEYKTYSDWFVQGKFKKFINTSNKREYIHSISDVNMFNKVLGKFKLEDNTSYKFWFENKLGKRAGKDVTKSIDDYWFTKKRLDELIHDKEIKSIEENLIAIALEI